jgi:hypothetical protein
MAADRRPCSQFERFRYPPGQIILGHRGVDLDDTQVKTPRFLADAFGEHLITREQIAQGPFRVTRVPGDLAQRAPTVERGPAELWRREEPNRMMRAPRAEASQGAATTGSPRRLRPVPLGAREGLR